MIGPKAGDPIYSADGSRIIRRWHKDFPTWTGQIHFMLFGKKYEIQRERSGAFRVSDEETEAALIKASAHYKW